MTTSDEKLAAAESRCVALEGALRRARERIPDSHERRRIDEALAAAVPQPPREWEVCGESDGLVECELERGHDGDHACPSDDLSNVRTWKPGTRPWRDVQAINADGTTEPPRQGPAVPQGEPQVCTCGWDGAKDSRVPDPDCVAHKGEPTPAPQRDPCEHPKSRRVTLRRPGSFVCGDCGFTSEAPPAGEPTPDEQSVLERWLMAEMAEARSVDEECAIARNYAVRCIALLAAQPAPASPPRDAAPPKRDLDEMGRWSFKNGWLVCEPRGATECGISMEKVHELAGTTQGADERLPDGWEKKPDGMYWYGVRALFIENGIVYGPPYAVAVYRALLDIAAPSREVDEAAVRARVDEAATLLLTRRRIIVGNTNEQRFLTNVLVALGVERPADQGGES